MDITVYTQPSCGGCIATKKTLDRLGISYTLAKLADNPNVVDELRSQGHEISSAPIVVAGDRVWSGFQPDELAALAR